MPPPAFCPQGKPLPDLRLADPTFVVVTDGSPEAEASVMRARLQAARALAEREASA